MYLDSLRNWNPRDHEGVTYDVFITFFTDEPRSLFYLQNFNGDSVKKFALAAGDISDSLSLAIEEHGFFRINPDHIASSLISAVSSLSVRTNILIDIACMPREIMAEVLACLLSIGASRPICLRVVYTIAKYTLPPSDIRANESIEAVHSAFSGWSYADSKPTSLVLGLGYEPFKAEGASEYFEPYEQWVFIPESPVLEYLPKVLSNNEELISRNHIENKVVRYRVDDPEFTFGQLEQVVSSLIVTTNPVLMPFGPKIFFFLCLIQSVSHPEVGVWQVTDNNLGVSTGGEASEYSFGIECVFVSLA